MLDTELESMLTERETSRKLAEENYQKELCEREAEWKTWGHKNNIVLMELTNLIGRWINCLPSEKRKQHYLIPETDWAIFVSCDGQIGLGLGIYYTTADQSRHYLTLYANENLSYAPRHYEAKIDVLSYSEPDKFHVIDVCLLIADKGWWSRCQKYMADFEDVCEKACKWMKSKLRDFQEMDV